MDFYQHPIGQQTESLKNKNFWFPELRLLSKGKWHKMRKIGISSTFFSK
jgi:hypothetical protein